MRNYQEKLAEAARRKFSKQITGFLFDVRARGRGIRGAIFYDALSRYEDGDTFTTSDVLETWQEHGYTLFLTVSGSFYVAVSHMLFVEETLDGVMQTMIMRAS